MDTLGVVDPLRVPAPVASLVRRIPTVAWVFIVAAAIDAVGRIVLNAGTFLLGGIVDLGDFVLWVLARDLVILLPAIALARRSTIPVDAPRTFWGLVLIAAGTVLRSPVTWVAGYLPSINAIVDPGSQVLGAVISAVAPLVVAAGWVVLARGLLPRNAGRPLRPSMPVVALAALAAATLVVAVIVLLASVAGSSPWDAFADGDATAIFAGAATFAIVNLVWGLLAWAFIRAAAADRSRAALAAAAWSVVIAVDAGILLVSTAFGTSIAPVAPALNAASVAVAVAAPALLISAFAFGLADPPGDEASAGG